MHPASLLILCILNQAFFRMFISILIYIYMERNIQKVTVLNIKLGEKVGNRHKTAKSKRTWYASSVLDKIITYQRNTFQAPNSQEKLI